MIWLLMLYSPLLLHSLPCLMLWHGHISGKYWSLLQSTQNDFCFTIHMVTSLAKLDFTFASTPKRTASLCASNSQAACHELHSVMPSPMLVVGIYTIALCTWSLDPQQLICSLREGDFWAVCFDHMLLVVPWHFSSSCLIALHLHLVLFPNHGISSHCHGSWNERGS